MKRSLIFLIFSLLCLQSFASIDGPRERVYVQTDKEFYLSGEMVWLKMLTTTETGVPQEFSRVGYIELLDDSGARAQVSLQVDKGIGQGAMVLPSDLQTGTYRLVGYTRYMRNEAADVFFEKIIGVVNPLDPQVTISESDDREKFPTAYSTPTSLSGNGIRLSADRTEYTTRELVEIDIQGIPSDIHTLSVVVTGRDLTDSYPHQGISQWNSYIPSAMPVNVIWEAECEGHIINGKISKDGSAYNAEVFPVVAFQGDDVRVFISQPDDDGKVSFPTRRAIGYSEVVTSMAGKDSEGIQLELESPFTSQHTPKQLPLLDIEQINKQLLLQRSISLQVQYSYVADSLTFFRYTAPELFEKPFWRYYMEDYAKFGTMGEVIIEYVNFARFRTVAGKRRLGVVRTDTGLQNNSLVLLDGIPVFDHDIIYNYNPLLLERIDIYNGYYIFGGIRYEGIIALYTEQNNATELTPDPFTRIVQYDMPQAPRYFYSPDHSSPAASDRLPDFRLTLYWNPDVKTGSAEAVSIPFYTSDLTGEYRIRVEGITDSGTVVWASHDITVK